MVPTKETFGDILDRLEAGGEQAIREILNDSWDAIVEVLKIEDSKPKDRSEKPIVWRGGAREREQEKGEKAYVKQISKRLNISVQEASVLLRDFILLSQVRNVEWSVNELSVTAPIEELRLLRMEEIRSQFACFATVIRIADDAEHPGNAVCKERLKSTESSAFGDQIVSAIQSLSSTISKSAIDEFDDKQRTLRWAVELAFIYFYSNSCSKTALLKLVELIRSGRVEWSASGATRTTLLLSMTFAETLSLERLLDSGRQIPKSSILSDSESRREVSKMLLASPKGVLDIGITSLAWATFLKLVQVSEPGIDVRSQPFEEHLEYALNAGVLEALPPLLDRFSHGGVDSIEPSPQRLGEVAGGLVQSFFVGFPPGILSRAQIRALSFLCSRALRYSTQLCHMVLDAERDLEQRREGINLIIRTSQAFFPLEVEPYVLIIGALAADEECSNQVVNILSEGLGSYAEASPERNLEYPVPVDDEGFVDARRDVPFVEAMASVSMGVVVRNRGDPTSAGEGTILRDSVGFTTDDMSTVIWHQRWNGWIAVNQKFRSFAEELRMGSDLAGLSVISSLCSMLIRICRHADFQTKSYVADEVISSNLIADVLMLVTRRKVGFMRSEKEKLMTLLARTLYELGRQNPRRCEHVLTRIGALGPGAPPLREIATFGGVTTPSLRYILQLAGEVKTTSRSLEHLLEFVTSEILPMWISSRLGVSSRGDSLRGWRLIQSVFSLLRKHVSISNARSPTLAKALGVTLSASEDRKAKSKPSAAYYCSLGNALKMATAIMRFELRHMEGRESEMLDENNSKHVVANSLSVTALAMISANSFPSPTMSLPTAVYADGDDNLDGDSHDDDLSDWELTPEDYDMPLAPEIQDRASRCLGLLFQVVERLSPGGAASVKQVPWPTGDHAQSIRTRLASAISSRQSFWAMSMVCAAIVHGQKGVSRALLKGSQRIIRFAPPAGGTPQSGDDKTAVEEDEQDSIIAAACEVAKKAKAGNLSGEPVSARSTNAAIELLRTAWDEYGDLWLKSVYKKCKVWVLLREMLSKPASLKSLTMPGLISIEEVKVADSTGIVQDSLAETSDEVAEWRLALANVIYTLSSEAVTSSAGDGETQSASDSDQTSKEDSKNASMLREICNEGWTDVVFSAEAREELMVNLEELSESISELSTRCIGSPLSFAPSEEGKMLGRTFVVELGPALQAKNDHRGIDPASVDVLVQRLSHLNILLSRSEAYSQLLGAFAAANIALHQFENRKKSSGILSPNPLATPNAKSSPRYLTELSSRASRMLKDLGPRQSTLRVRAEIALMLASLAPVTPSGIVLDREMIDEELKPNEVLQNITTSLRNWYTSSPAPNGPFKKYPQSLLLAGARHVPYCGAEAAGDFVSAVLEGFDNDLGTSGESLQAAVAALTLAKTTNESGRLQASLRGLYRCSKMDGLSAAETADSMLFLMLRLLCDPAIMSDRFHDELLRCFVGALTTSSLLNGAEIPGYLDDSLERNPSHKLYCTLLKVSAALISSPEEGEPRSSSMVELFSFLSRHLESHSLDLSGDWPSISRSTSQHLPRHISLARLYEAEAALALLWSFSGHTGTLSTELPAVLDSIMKSAKTFFYEGYRLLRAEPIQRWVVPVSSAEVKESASLGQTTAGEDTTPVKSNDFRGSPATESAREAVGRRYISAAPPSPIMPQTPLTAMNTYQTPDGLLDSSKSEDNLKFGEEAVLTILRAMRNALACIRRYSSYVAKPLFEPTMVLSADRPSLGLLIAVQLHATHELQRGLRDDNRDIFHSIAENAFVITIRHTVGFINEGMLTSGVREELRKRLQTIVDRQKQLVPPLPRDSLIHAPEMSSFLQTLK
uniref:Uncharacterized protein n=2 Tax=Rhodosorus marinus TaxID=101924 RepID=A0A7S2Z9D0_9RHOD|mmetsp:Transcript_1011/g.2561  ORF Transcript_1011/g.2561 Transcript_1011/m.2561 type:complete len:1850 (+) Transcript_1011:464-6013(+)|eukprot:CAMPEP_0113954726 /NCGR_PEP_ID=MMETSP0011_2-20120614/788_1 /TAXON_ID=101924 /ORGANISM="Rhodosorus marinus" /LENGTH=1849 /DNA_ID=CAMNT_0000964037 /DNA_START=17 /DNA_END=5566 /DNA_ORIENTATION=- /assembly_acc=CAM_ASM_000156